MFVKPALGLKVRCPQPPHPFLPETGQEVSLSEFGGYWARRLAQKDIVDATAEQNAAAAEAEAKAQAAQQAAEAAAKAAATADAAAAQAAATAAAATAAVHNPAGQV